MKESDPTGAEASSGDNGRKCKVSDEELLHKLNNLAETLGKTPSVREMDGKGEHSATTYRKRFGSWNEAVRKAGLKTNSNTPDLSDGTLLENLKEFAFDLNSTPTQKEMRQEGPHASSTYVKRFGTWNKAVRKAGLEPNTQGSKFSDQDLIDELERVATTLGHIPTQEEFGEKSEVSVSSYYNHFDTWKSAIKNGDLEERYDPPSEFDISTENLIDEIKKFESVLDRAPTIAEMDELGAYSERTYRRRFGSWSRSLEKANVNNQQKQDKTRISKQKLIVALRTLADELGRSPSFEDVWNHGKYGAATYLYRFGTWNKALEAAGLQPRLDRSEQIPDRDLIIELRRLAGELGYIPRRKEMEDMGEYSGATYYNHFGSWKESLDKAGFSKDSDTGEMSLTARCFTCARMISRSVIDISDANLTFCDAECENIWKGKESVRFEEIIESVYGDEKQIPDVFVKSFASDILVAEILICLRLVIITTSTAIDSAVSGDYQIEKRKNAIAITRLNTEANNQLLISHETADQLYEAVIEHSDLISDAILNPAMAG